MKRDRVLVSPRGDMVGSERHASPEYKTIIYAREALEAHRNEKSR